MASETTVEDVLAEWPFQEVYPHDDGAVADYLTAITTVLTDVDQSLTDVADARRLQTASGDSLARLAREVGVERRDGETDDHLRFRALIRKAAARSNGTIPDIAQLLVVLFPEYEGEMSVDAATDAPQVTIVLPQIAVDESPYTQAELAEDLRQLTPSAETVDIVTDDTLVLGESGSQGVGGTLA